MQSPNFPNFVLRLTVWPGRNGSTKPVVQFTKVPARYSTKTVATVSGRRIALERLGKVEVIADSYQTLIMRAWVANEEDVLVVATAMVDRMRGIFKRRVESLKACCEGMSGRIEVNEVKYEPS